MVMHRVCVEAGSHYLWAGNATGKVNSKQENVRRKIGNGSSGPQPGTTTTPCVVRETATGTDHPGRRAPSHSLERKQGASAILWGARRWATTSRRRLRQGPRRTALRFSRGSHTFASNATLRFAARRARRRLWQPAASSARNGDLRKVHGFQDFGPFALALLQHRQRLPHYILGFAVPALFNRPADKLFLVGT
jgi:hypothetical protein